jgi:hypothetical protein
VGLERGPLSLVSTTEELLDKTSSGSCLENREYCRRDPSRWPRVTLYPQKLAITSPTSSGRSVGIVRSWTQTMEFVCLFALLRYTTRLWARRLGFESRQSKVFPLLRVFHIGSEADPVSYQTDTGVIWGLFS